MLNLESISKKLCDTKKQIKVIHNFRYQYYFSKLY